MILLFIVDVITIIVNSYLALIVRYKMDGNTVPVEDLASVNTYLLINIVTTMIIFLLLNLYISAFYGFKDPGHCRVVLSPVFLYPLHRLQAELLLRIY